AAGCGRGDGACAASASMQAVQTAVFDGCATSGNGGCHQVAPFGAGLNLSAGRAWTELAHAPSNSSPGEWRVVPGDVDGSFLWQKLNDELATDGTEGVAMPRDAADQWAQLDAAQLAMVRCWIASGAPAD
ncbi:MAG TPA: hypothetical protein VF945_07280, partial [Polyangia bacterium]